MFDFILSQLQQRQDALQEQIQAVNDELKYVRGADYVRKQKEFNHLAQLFDDVEQQIQSIKYKLNTQISMEGMYSDDSSVHKPVINIESETYFAHLVIAIYWQEKNKYKIRVNPKICYYDSEEEKNVNKPLMNEQCSFDLDEFPYFLENLVKFSIEYLSKKLDSEFKDWTLLICLYVPVDLLCSSLSRWCIEDSGFLTLYPFVLGCSDRFDPDQPTISAELYHQLKRGWQRFQSKVPDDSSLTLQHLDWLSSDDASQENFGSYSGFQCYGDWLNRDESLLQHWKELVRSGIPLALWVCENRTQRAEVVATYNYLINRSRFAFLEEIPKLRDQYRKKCKFCIGVYFENPHYVPDVPLAEETQFFSWPGV